MSGPTQVLLHCQWASAKAGGATPTGSVTFALTAPMLDSLGHVIAPTDPISMTLVNGGFDITLNATNDTTTFPSGLAYLVTERINGNANNSYLIQLDKAKVVQYLSDIIPASTASSSVTYVAVDGTGFVPAAQLGSGTAVPSTGTSDMYLRGDRSWQRSAARMERHNLAALRSWHAALAKAHDATYLGIVPVDVMFCGDSVTEGWTGDQNGPAGTRFGRVRSNLAAMLNGSNSGRYGRWVPAGSAWYSNDKFSANGTASEAPYGLSLRARSMPNGAAPATNTEMCDRILVHYRVRNVFATGNLTIKLDGVTQTQVSTFANDAPYCNVAFGSRVVIWDSGPLTRGLHTISVEQTTNGAASGAAAWDGAYFCDGDFAAGVRTYNCSHFGFNFANYNPDTVTNNDWLSTIRQNLISPRLMVWTHGINASPDVVTFETTMRSAIAGFTAAQAAAGQIPASQVIEVAWGTKDKDPALWEACRDICYKVGLELGIAVWEWNEYTGNVYTANDPLTLSIDNIHPNAVGHNMIGDWESRKILEHISPAVPLVQVNNTLQAVTADLVTPGEGSIPNRDDLTGSVTMTSGMLRLRYFTAAKTETITQVKVTTSATAAGATPTLCQVGIFIVDPAGNLILIAGTNNDTTLFAAANTTYTKALTGSWAKTAGYRYAVGILVITAAAAPTIVGISNTFLAPSLLPRQTAQLAGQASMPASVAVGSLADSGSSPYVVMTP